MMAYQLIIVVESDEYSKSDYIYINSILNEVYEIKKRNDIKISPVYMKGKGNYKKVGKRISALQKIYKNIGESYVIYCFDTDKYDVDSEANRILCEEKKYCVDNGYDFIWFCHDIEEVFLGKSVAKSEKTEKAKQYITRHKIKDLRMAKLKSNVMARGKSNLLLILEKYLNNDKAI